MNTFTMSARSIYTGVLANNNMHIKAISPKWKGDGIGTAECNIWDLNPFERGDVIHQIMGLILRKIFQCWICMMNTVGSSIDNKYKHSRFQLFIRYRYEEENQTAD